MNGHGVEIFISCKMFENAIKGPKFMSYFTLSQSHLVGWIVVPAGLILALCLTPLT